MDTRYTGEEKETLLGADHLQPLTQPSSSSSLSQPSTPVPAQFRPTTDEPEHPTFEFKIAPPILQRKASGVVNVAKKMEDIIKEYTFDKVDGDIVFYNKATPADFTGSPKTEDYYNLPVTTKFKVTHTNPFSSFFRGLAATWGIRHIIGATFVEIPDKSVGLYTAGDGRTHYLLGAGKQAIYGDHGAKLHTVIPVKSNFAFGDMVVTHTPQNQFTPATLADDKGVLHEGLLPGGTNVVKTTEYKFLNNIIQPKKRKVKKGQEEKHLEVKEVAAPEVKAQEVADENAQRFLLGNKLSYDPSITKRFPIGAHGKEAVNIYDRKFMLLKKDGVFRAVLGPDLELAEPNSLFVSDSDDPDSYMAVNAFKKIELNKLPAQSSNKKQVFYNSTYLFEVTKEQEGGQKTLETSLDALNLFQRGWGPSNTFIRYEDDVSKQTEWPDQDKVVQKAQVDYVAAFSFDDLENELIPLDLLSKEALNSKGGKVVRNLLQEMANHGLTLLKCEITLPTNEQLDKIRQQKADEQLKISEALKATRLANDNALRKIREDKQSNDERVKQEQALALAAIEAEKAQNEKNAELAKKRLEIQQNKQTADLAMREKEAALELARKTEEAKQAKQEAENNLTIAKTVAQQTEAAALAQAALDKAQAESADKIAKEKAAVEAFKESQNLQREQEKAQHEAKLAQDRQVLEAQKANNANQLAIKQAEAAQTVALDKAAAELLRTLAAQKATVRNDTDKLSNEAKLAADKTDAEAKAAKAKQDAVDAAKLAKLTADAAAKTLLDAEENRVKLEAIKAANEQLRLERAEEEKRVVIEKAKADAALKTQLEEQERKAAPATKKKELDIAEDITLKAKKLEAEQAAKIADLKHQNELAIQANALKANELKLELDRKDQLAKADLAIKVAEAAAAKQQELDRLEVEQKKAEVEAVRSTAHIAARLKALGEVLQSPDRVAEVLKGESEVEKVKHAKVQPFPPAAPVTNVISLPKNMDAASAAAVSSYLQTQTPYNMYASAAQPPMRQANTNSADGQEYQPLSPSNAGR